MHHDLEKKILSSNTLINKMTKWHQNNEKVVFTNGCFDILHRGHLDYLLKAASFGDKFIIAVNSDRSVKALNKGKERPLQDENSRAAIIASLFFVDAVIIFNEDTPYELISKLIPDILVKGGDWKESEIVGNEIVKNNGGEVKSIDFLEGYSTSGIIDKIKKSTNNQNL
ncbi:MAG: D-glycero-beta-D-manno-heptose 1-phosphate adenylyltransferase [Flavobacteriales bacterium]